MVNYYELFLQYLDAERVKYTSPKEYCVRIQFAGENMRTIPISVFFDPQKPVVHVLCSQICNLGRNKDFALRVCNEANVRYGWVKFYMDVEGDVISSVDAYLEEHTCGWECLQMVKKVAAITDEAYRIFVGEVWA